MNSGDHFWTGVATGILISAVFGAVIYFAALIECCIL